MKSPRRSRLRAAIVIHYILVKRKVRRRLRLLRIRDRTDRIDAIRNHPDTITGILGDVTQWRSIRIAAGNFRNVVLIAYNERKLGACIVTRK